MRHLQIQHDQIGSAFGANLKHATGITYGEHDPCSRPMKNNSSNQ